MSEGFRGGGAGAGGRGAAPRGERAAGAAPARPERAGGGGVRRLPRRVAQRGGRPHRLHAPARAPDVQGLAEVQPGRRAGRSRASSSASAPTSTPPPGSTAPTTTRPCRRSTWSWRSSSRRTACADALLREEDLATEMTVVRNEFERGENDPFDVLLKESFAIAFREHPYHHPTIGWRSDIENTSIDTAAGVLRHLLLPGQRLAGAGGRRSSAARRWSWWPGTSGRCRAAPRAVAARGDPGAAPGGGAPLRRAPGRRGRAGSSSRGAPPRRRTPTPTPSRCWPTPSAGGVTSRLYQRLVETGLCLDVQAVAWQLRDPGPVPGVRDAQPAHAAREGREDHPRGARRGRPQGALRGRARSGPRPRWRRRRRTTATRRPRWRRGSPRRSRRRTGASTSTTSDRIRAVDARRRAAGGCGRRSSTTRSRWGTSSRATARGGSAPVPRARAAAAAPRPVLPARRSWPRRSREAALPGGGRLPPAAAPQQHHGPPARLAAGRPRAGRDRGVDAPPRCVPDMLERGTATATRASRWPASSRTAASSWTSRADGFNPLEVFCSGRCLSRHLPLRPRAAGGDAARAGVPGGRAGEAAHAAPRASSRRRRRTRSTVRSRRSRASPTRPGTRTTAARSTSAGRRSSALTREQLAAVHRKLYGPASLVLALVGDFEPGAGRAAASAELLGGCDGGLPRGPAGRAARPARRRRRRGPRDDARQAQPGRRARAPGRAAARRRRLPRRRARQLGARPLDALVAPRHAPARPGGAHLRRDLALLRRLAARRPVGGHVLGGAGEPGAGAWRRSARRSRGYVAEGPSEAELADERAAMAGSYRVGLATPAGDGARAGAAGRATACRWRRSTASPRGSWRPGGEEVVGGGPPPHRPGAPLPRRGRRPRCKARRPPASISHHAARAGGPRPRDHREGPPGAPGGVHRADRRDRRGEVAARAVAPAPGRGARRRRPGARRARPAAGGGVLRRAARRRARGSCSPSSGVDGGDELVLRREVSAAGRSRAWINDVTVTVGALQRLAPYLLAIHGQHEQRGLTDPSTHIALVDAAGGLTGECGRGRRGVRRAGRRCGERLEAQRRAARARGATAST